MNIKDIQAMRAALAPAYEKWAKEDGSHPYTNGFEAGFEAGLHHARAETPAKTWRPVADRLPERRGIYDVMLSDGTVGTPAFYCGAFDRDVIAWMPKPKPYNSTESADGSEVSE